MYPCAARAAGKLCCGESQGSSAQARAWARAKCTENEDRSSIWTSGSGCEARDFWRRCGTVCEGCTGGRFLVNQWYVFAYTGSMSAGSPCS